MKAGPSRRSWALAVWIALALPGGALAQEAAAEAAPPPPAGAALPDAGGEEFVVTGTRIRGKDLTGAAPVTVIPRERIESSGKLTLGDFLQTLPEQANATNASVNNGGDGSVRVNLRGLGVNRTLVLLNGRRVVAGGIGADLGVDVATIPLEVVERIEVLKDGASPTYGSDAIAGVVNVITRRGYTGTSATARAGTSTHGDGSSYDVGLTTGASGELGSILFSAGYARQREVFASERRWSEQPLRFDFKTGTASYAGSGTVPVARFTVPTDANGAPLPCTGDPAKCAFYGQLLGAYPDAVPNPSPDSPPGFFIRDPAAPLGWRPYASTDTYNFQGLNYLVTPAERVSLFSAGHARLTRDVRAFFEGSFVNRQSSQRFAPANFTSSGALRDGTGIVVSRDNAYNPFGVDFTDFSRRITEAGDRSTGQDLDAYRLVGGVEGVLPASLGPLGGWSWDTSINYGRTSGPSTTAGFLRLSRIQAAVGPSFTDATGVLRCGDPVTRVPIPGCVPLNLFGPAGSITPEQLASVGYSGTARGYNELLAWQVNASGALFRLRSDRPVALAAGYELRRESGGLVPDPVAAEFDSTGANFAPTAGAFTVNEGYAELSVPVASGLAGVHALDLTAAVRVSAYSTFGTNWTYKLAARYAPVRDVTFRGTWSTGFRAPAIQELYAGAVDNYPGLTDPCADLTRASPALVARCRAEGVPAGGNGDDRFQIRTRNGGNAALQPETAVVYTAGVVLEPRWARNLSLTVDYYRTSVDNSIAPRGAAAILTACYPTDGTPPPPECASGGPGGTPLVVRDPATGKIAFVNDFTVNVGRDVTDGVDVALRYALPTPAGRFGLFLDATWLHRFDRTFFGGKVVEGKGTYDLAQAGLPAGVGQVFPALRFAAGLTWALGRLDASVLARYVGSYKECGNAQGLSGTDGLCADNPQYSRTVDAYDVWDLFVRYTLPSPLGRTALAAGVQNVFDRSPPYVYDAFQNSADPTAYDFMGRYFYLRITQAFP